MVWVRERKISALGALSWVETDRLQGWFLLLWLTHSLQRWDRQANTHSDTHSLMCPETFWKGSQERTTSVDHGAQTHTFLWRYSVITVLCKGVGHVACLDSHLSCNTIRVSNLFCTTAANVQLTSWSSATRRRALRAKLQNFITSG